MDAKKVLAGLAAGFLLLLLPEPGYPQTAGIVPQGVNFVISATSGPDAVGGRPAIAADGANFLVVWRDGGGNIAGARVSHAGSVLDPSGISIGAGSGPPSVAFDGTNFLVVWESGGEIFGARVTTSGTVLDSPALQITTGANSKIRPTGIAFGAGNYLIVWRTLVDDLFAARVSPTGTIVDGPAGFRIGRGFYPWATFDGTNYFVVWHDNGNGLDIFGNRIASDGTVLDGTGFVISNASEDQDHSSIACDGTNCLVVWHDTQGGADDGLNDGTARGTRVSASGVVLDNPPVLIADNVRRAPPVVVTYDGTDYFVVWQVDMTPAKFRLVDAFGRRVSTAGTVVDTAAVPLGTAYSHQWGPTIGFDSDRYLVAWSDRRFGTGVGAPTTSDCQGGCVAGQVLQKQAPASAAVQPADSSTLRDWASAALPEQTASVWASEPSPTGVPIYAVYGVDSNSAFATAEGPKLRYDGNMWIAEASGQRMFGVWAANASDVWGLGSCWATSRFDGVNWSPDQCHGTGPPGDPYQIGYGIWGSSPTNILTVGTWGGFQIFDGAGGGVGSSTGTTADAWDIWGTSATNVYAVSQFGTILHYDGNSWTPVANVPTIQNLNAVWGTGPSDIFVVGDFGTILHYDGSSWGIQDSGTLEHLFGVWGFSPADVYAVGFNGTILHYDGNSWTPDASGTTAHLLDVGIGGNNVWAVGDQGTILRKTVTFPTPAINPGGTVNGASFASGAGVAPGSITSVFGTNLASFGAGAGAVPLPTTLGGATMQFNGTVAVPKFFASALQVNIQIPWELTGQGSANLTDTVNGMTSTAQTVGLANFSPGLFATNQAGTGQGAILVANTGGTVAAPVGAFPNSRPVMRGTEFISIFCTGLGPVNNQPGTGNAATDASSTTTTMLTVTIGGVAANVTFSGLAPGFVGLYQVNAQVPAGAPTGDAVDVVLTIGGVPSNTVTIAVQ